MTLLRSKTSRIRVLALLVMAGTTLSACSPTPEPTPTPTAAFSSEEEAFAAAEAVYRAYTDALNQQREGTATVDPLDFLTGLALESELDAYESIRAQGLTLVGQSVVAAFDPKDVDLKSVPAQIRAEVCVDISKTRVIDADEDDVTPTDRREHLPLLVTFATGDSGLMISNSQSLDQATC